MVSNDTRMIVKIIFLSNLGLSLATITLTPRLCYS